MLKNYILTCFQSHRYFILDNISKQYKKKVVFQFSQRLISMNYKFSSNCVGKRQGSDFLLNKC